MSSEVKRYDVSRGHLYPSGALAGTRTYVKVVTARDYDALAAEVERLRERLAAIEGQKPVAWGAFHFGGSRSGKLYTHCETEQQIESYIADAHRGNDSITLRKGPLYAAPIAQAAPDVQDVSALVEALEECAASLAWNCFGECRAIHAGPIMPAAKALETARKALSAHNKQEGGVMSGMSDKELLELAAKAAGYQVDTGFADCPLIFGEDAGPDGPREWNPLTDDGDALRLAVLCNLTICTDGTRTVSACQEFDRKNAFATQSVQECGGCKLSATRRAIVRAAALAAHRKQGSRV